MSLRSALLATCALGLACAGQQAGRSSESLFDSPAAELARKEAPDLYLRAEAAWAESSDAQRRKHEHVADDHRTEARLWLAASIAESERLELERRRDAVELEEERWAKQLARDQAASAIVAGDISRYEARAVALREAERVAALSQTKTANAATIDAVVTRLRLNLALAEALGATDAQLAPLRERTQAFSRKRPQSARVAEALLLDTEALIGDMRAKWPSPQPGAGTELVETAWLTGFTADRTGNGVVVRSERFFSSGGQVSVATVKRFHGLLAAFPHGPVACQVAVPELRSRVWVRRVAQLVERLGRMDDPRRVSTGMIETQSLAAGSVQCTFAAYREP